MVNVIPWQDTLRHQPGPACACWPRVEFFDPKDGKRWEDGPIIIHNAQDGRELFEHFGFPSGKWMTVRS